MSIVEEEIHTAALDYAARGLCVLPIRAGRKIPAIDEWQLKASKEAKEIDRWWGMWPNCNVGIQLGPRSGIIDVECDSIDAEALLRQAFGEDPPVAPTFIGKRGKHRLFSFIAGQFPDAAVAKIAGIEFRLGGGAKGAQSIFPPSVHPDGDRYRWVGGNDLENVGIAPFPQAAIDWLIQHTENGDQLAAKSPRKKSKLKEILKGVNEGGRNNAAASLIGRLLAGLADPCDNNAVGALWPLVVAWNATNEPPMGQRELQTTFESILRAEQTASIERSHSNFLTAMNPMNLDAAVGLEPAIDPLDPPPPPRDDGHDPIKGWKLVIVQSKPRKYKLFSPRWTGSLILTAEDLRDWRAIGKKAVEQKDCWLEPWLDIDWVGAKGKGTRPGLTGIAPVLLATAQSEEAPPEEVRDQVVAEMLHTRLLSNTRQPTDDGLPDAGGSPTRFQDGSYVFAFKVVWEDLARSDDRIGRGELSELLKSIGCVEKNFTVKGKRSRWKVLNAKAFKTLENLLGF